MPKFSTNQRSLRPKGPITAKAGAAPVPTYEGGDGHERSTESELFVLAASNMVGEQTFYEAGESRDKRFADLVHAVTQGNPEWLRGPAPEEGRHGFINYLRQELNMRSATIVAACEYVAAGGAGGRQVIDVACSRADEPAEVLGYWLATYGRKIPMPVKRGVADAARRLYTEQNAIKYDGQSKDIRMGDVIEIVHARPKAPWQSDLFKHLIDERHKRGNPIPESLTAIASDRFLLGLPEGKRREVYRSATGQERIAAAHWPWERVGGWLPGGMDAEAWEGVIPQMGIMALTRNLRNFDKAGVADRVKDAIVARLMDPETIAKSRMFPFRFLSAFKEAPSLDWGRGLERALDLSCQNIPKLSGSTLVMVDTSGSMQATISDRSKVIRAEIGAVFASAMAKRNPGTVRLCGYGQNHGTIDFPQATASLKVAAAVSVSIGRWGHATYTWTSTAQCYRGEDRVVIFTDDQAQDSPSMYPVIATIPTVWVCNLGGYRVGQMHEGPGRHTLAGFSDASFKLMEVLERRTGADATWPWEQS